MGQDKLFNLAAPSLNGTFVNSVEEGAQKVGANASEGWDLKKIHPDIYFKAKNKFGLISMGQRADIAKRMEKS